LFSAEGAAMPALSRVSICSFVRASSVYARMLVRVMMLLIASRLLSAFAPLPKNRIFAANAITKSAKSKMIIVCAFMFCGFYNVVFGKDNLFLDFRHVCSLFIFIGRFADFFCVDAMDIKSKSYL
jgi:hypothetical protein